MNRERKILLNVVILVIALGMAGVSYAEPMGTAFTYQGRLVDANSPAEGLYDFEFEVYDTLDGGSQQGSTVSKDDVDVIDSYFTVELDFGSSVFTGDARWLQVAVRPGASSDPCDFATLSPRQELTPAPYAMHSKNADTLDDLDSADFASSVHNHDGSDIISGQVDETHIDPDMATDSELSSGLATKSDISHSHDGVYSLISHNHDGVYSPVSHSHTVTSAMIQDGTITTADLAFSPLTNPYTGNLSITGNLDLTGYLDMDMYDIDNVDDVEADRLMAERLYLGSTYGSDGAGDGEIKVYDDAGNETILLDSDWNNGSFFRLKNDTGNICTVMEASDYGKMFLYSDTGSSTIQLYGGYGSSGGSVRVNGSTVHDYADVYSFVSSANPLPGQVVSIATDGKLDISSTAYDSKVAGIVSGGGDLSSGMIIGGDKDDPHTAPIAVSGRVYCYVDATENAVEIGDLLTTSDTPGYAMKAVDRDLAFGAVLGKAMEPLAEGEKGLVLVLVCLN